MTVNNTIRFFTSKDADPAALVGERVAVIGYGNLGRPFALNLRDSGVSRMVIGNIADKYADQGANRWLLRSARRQGCGPIGSCANSIVGRNHPGNVLH